MAKRPKTSTKNLGGRPSKYDPAIADRLVEFFAIDSPYVPEQDNQGRTRMQPVRPPTIERFCAQEGISKETLYRWATETDQDGNLLRPEFSNAYQRAKEYQAAIMGEGLALGAYNASGGIFVAKNLLGWHDKQEVQHGGGMSVSINLDTKPPEGDQ